MNPSLWFSVTDASQFLVVLPIGFAFGFLVLGDTAGVRLGIVAIRWLEGIAVFWIFLLAARAFAGRIPWEASIGTFLLNLLFVVTIYLGRVVRSAREGR